MLMSLVQIIIAFAAGLIVSTSGWAKEVITIENSSLEVSGISYVLNEDGSLVVKSEHYPQDIEIEVPDGFITKIFEVRGRVVLISSHRSAYLLNMPVPKNMLSKGLTSWASRSRMADLFQFQWLHKFRPQLVKLEYLKIGNQNVHIYHANPVVRAGENDLILKSMWESYSLRQLLSGLDSQGQPSEQICASLLNPF